MKLGRFEESIAVYDKALEIEPSFVRSYLGIGWNRVLMGRADEGRQSFDALMRVAVNVAQKRQALFWKSLSYAIDERFDEALRVARERAALSEAAGDLAGVAADRVFMGTLLLEAGRPDEAQASYEEALDVIGEADVPDETKAAMRRNHLYYASRVQFARGDSRTARSLALQFKKAADAVGVPFEVRRAGELGGMVRISDRKATNALRNYARASQQDPRVLYLTAQAYRMQGDGVKARAFCEKAARFNALDANFAYIRNDAQRLLAELTR